MDDVEKLVIYLEKTGSRLIHYGTGGLSVRFREGFRDSRTAIIILDILQRMQGLDALSLDQYERLHSAGLLQHETPVERIKAVEIYERIDRMIEETQRTLSGG